MENNRIFSAEQNMNGRKPEMSYSLTHRNEVCRPNAIPGERLMERDSRRRCRISPCSYVKEERHVFLHAPHNADSEGEGAAAEQEPRPGVDSAEHPGVGYGKYIRHCAREKIQPDGVAPYPVSEFQWACALAYVYQRQHA